MEEDSEMMPMEGSPGSGDYGMEMDDMQGHMEDMDGYGDESQGMSQEDGDDDSLNFDQDPQYANLPPLDKMRKVRREIVKTINDFRAAHGHPKVYLDPNTNQAAYEYAKYLLNERAWDNPDEGQLEELCQHYKLIPKQKAIVGYSHLDDDAAGGDFTKMAEHMDAHGLLLEM